MTYSIIRYIVVALLAWLVGKGVISKDQANSNLPGIVNACVLAASIAGAVILSYLQKWYNGWLAKNPPPSAEEPLSSPTITSVITSPLQKP